MQRAVSYPRMVRLPRRQICQGCQLTANSPRRMRLPKKITSLQRASWPSKAILLRRQLCHKGWLHQGWHLCQGWPHRGEGRVSRERNVHLPCQLQKGNTRRESGQQHPTGLPIPNMTQTTGQLCCIQGGVPQGILQDAKGITIKTDFTMEGQLPQNCAVNGVFAMEGTHP